MVLSFGVFDFNTYFFVSFGVCVEKYYYLQCGGLYAVQRFLWFVLLFGNFSFRFLLEI